MLEAAEQGLKVSKDEYAAAEPGLRVDLINAQYDLQNADFSVVLVIAGDDRIGMNETIQFMHEWMDARYLETHIFRVPSREELERPRFWRYWRDIPPKGRMGVYLSGRYSAPLLQRVYGEIEDTEFDDRLAEIIRFENTLADDGALILKFWMHLGHEAQKTRLKKLEKDPLTSWRVTQRDWDHWHIYDRFESAAERTIMRTSTGTASWNIVEGMDPCYRSLTVGTIVRDEIRKHLQRMEQRQQLASAVPAEPAAGTDTAEGQSPTPLPVATVLSRLDMSMQLSKADYKKQLQEWQAKLNQLHRKALKKKKSAILVFEGADAAGKGGAIRRITAALDARHYQVIPIAAPTDEERAQHYLWRFWRHLSRAGRISIFDRSWYGRVLVERIEGFATEPEWRRAYAEINDYEEQLTEHGIVLLKYWIHISKDEQLERFRLREQTPHKQWKLTDEDWRNREKWFLYEQAVNDMVTHTSTTLAPWTLVEGNDKRYARVKIVATCCEALEQALDRRKKAKKSS